MVRTRICDLAIVGGGLAGGLIALALASKRPDLDVVLIEGDDMIGGNHIWSFFGSDIAPEDRWLVAPLVCHAWPGYRVAFPGYRRRLGEAYYAVLSERLDEVVRAALPDGAVITGLNALAVSRTAAVLESGLRVQAKAVIDTRGAGDLTTLDLGWQKFLGQVVRTAEPHGVERPVVMDAAVEQIDGYRFVHLLPLGEDRLLIEDNYYSDGPELDRDVMAARIVDYAAAQGWTIAAVEREESGVLPVALGGNFEAYWRSGTSGNSVGKAGMRAALFHPTTGYSLPDAVRTALLVAGLDNPASRTLHDALHDHARKMWKARRFYRRLGRMLLRTAAPDRRYKVLERFYRFDRKLIGRFYAARSTVLDRLRILSAHLPSPFGRGSAAVAEGKG